jgi:hypothetical protein
VLLGVVVQSTRQAADRPGFGQSRERLIHRGATGQIEKAGWCEDRAAAESVNAPEGFLFRRLHCFSHGVHVRKITCFSDGFKPQVVVSTRVLRRGCWIDYPHFCRAVGRAAGEPALRVSSYGFRVAFSLS